MFESQLYQVALQYLSNPSIFQHRFPFYSDLIANKSRAVEKIWGFIDGTLRETARPIRFQRAAYSGQSSFNLL